jgi:O-antigen/teichoic acid export membrane protein
VDASSFSELSVDALPAAVQEPVVLAGGPAPAGGVRRLVTRNVLWNWAGMAVQMLAGFITVPFLLRYLGQEGYSLWILIASLTGYFDLLDLGLRPSLGRHLAYAHAQGDDEELCRLFSTGLALLLLAGGLVLLGTLGVLALFPILFMVPEPFQSQTPLAVILIGLNLALLFPLFAFEALLWAYQRFDLINAVDIPAVVLRTGLTIGLVMTGGRLITLALIVLGVTLVSGTAKVLLAFRLAPQLHLHSRLLSWQAARELYGFGIWCVLMQTARVVTARAGEPIVGNRLAVGQVAPFSLAARLVSYTNSLMSATTGVLTPLATTWHAQGRQVQQLRLFLLGGRFCLALALFFVFLFWGLGQPLLDLWTQGTLPQAWPVLLVLIGGELVPLSQWVTYSMVLGMGRHRLWAGMSVLEAVSVLGLGLTVGARHGLLGVAFCLAGPACLCRGLVPLWSGCRLLGLSLRDYLRQIAWPALVAVTPPAVLLALVVCWLPPQHWNWPLLGVCAAGYGLAFLLSAVCCLLERQQRENYVQLLRQALRVGGESGKG